MQLPYENFSYYRKAGLIVGDGSTPPDGGGGNINIAPGGTNIDPDLLDQSGPAPDNSGLVPRASGAGDAPL